jgi:hypothetical protein
MIQNVRCAHKGFSYQATGWNLHLKVTACTESGFVSKSGIARGKSPLFAPFRAGMALGDNWRLVTGARPKQYTHI